jgi:hypothetical protein
MSLNLSNMSIISMQYYRNDTRIASLYEARKYDGSPVQRGKYLNDDE